MRPASHTPFGDSRDAVRQRLALRITRRFQTVTVFFNVGRARIAFTRVADPDRVLDEVAAEEDRLERVSGVRASSDQLRLPYWAELWDSSLGVGWWLVGWSEVGGGGSEERHATPSASVATHAIPTRRPRASVLDLGCGMGLAGTVAAALGHRVMFADLEPAALLFARLNTLPWHRRVRTRRLDWRTDRLGERFDLILGADILYERKQWDYLEPFWRAHLSPGGIVVLGEPGRQTGDEFIDWITPRGWTLSRREQKVETRNAPIRLFELRLG